MRPALPAVLLVAAALVLACGCTAPCATSHAKSNATPARGASWSFVVVGDSRAATKDTTTGINNDLAVLATAIAAEKPSFVLFPGDLVSGDRVDDDSPVYQNYQAQFKNWMEAMAPVHDYINGTGVPIYVVRGNHEDDSGGGRHEITGCVPGHGGAGDARERPAG